MSEQAWTIESISSALGNPAVVQRFLAEINRAPAPTLLNVFAKWQRIAETTLAAADRAHALAPYAQRGESLPGEWIDATERVMDETRSGHRGAA